MTSEPTKSIDSADSVLCISCKASSKFDGVGNHSFACHVITSYFCIRMFLNGCSFGSLLSSIVAQVLVHVFSLRTVATLYEKMPPHLIVNSGHHLDVPSFRWVVLR